MSFKPEPAAAADGASTASPEGSTAAVDGITGTTGTTATLETLVRTQLSKALGGRRGMLEGAIPTIGFTVVWIVAHDLKLALLVSGGLAVALLLLRVIHRSTVQFVLNSLVGIAIAAIFALRSGRAEDAFLPGVIYNAVYAVILGGSALLRWPVVGFMIGSVTGEPTAWHADRHLVALCSKLTWLLAVPCVLRVLVQYPLYRMHEAGWLGVAKLAMGWPLQVGALAAMVWLLSRDTTTVAVPVDIRAG